MNQKRKLNAHSSENDGVNSGRLSQILLQFTSSPANSTFTCGGTIPIRDLDAGPESSNKQLNSDVGLRRSGKRRKIDQEPQATQLLRGPGPIVFHWDREDGSAARIRFPLGQGGDAAQLETFVGDCEPAGFGHEGVTKYDNNVRKAWAMDGARFTTNLCPYTLGIVHRITQILLPNAVGVGSTGDSVQGTVTAELYKLNVYQGPSGFFKSHIDTPRKASQFASLVICIPNCHNGGALTVSHGNKKVEYHWDSKPGTDGLQWAAFYSDCKHEVQEVTKGHRITLTYNLYCEQHVPVTGSYISSLLLEPAPVDVRTLAPYTTMQALLDNRRWMRSGGTLGIYCAHAYPTTTSKVVEHEDHDYREPSPDFVMSDKLTALKGTDMSLYAVFTQLGLTVRLVPIMLGLDNLYPNEKLWPREGVQPGMVGKTDFITNEDEDAEWIPEAFGKLCKDVKWITQPVWRDLALIHGNYLGNEAGGPGVGYAYLALLVTIPKAAERTGLSE